MVAPELSKNRATRHAVLVPARRRSDDWPAACNRFMALSGAWAIPTQGFKHGCKTPACAAEGICACPAVPSGQNGAKPPAPNVASAAASSSGDTGGDASAVRTESQAKNGGSTAEAEAEAAQGPASAAPSTGDASLGATGAAPAAMATVEGSGKSPAPGKAGGGTEGAAPPSLEDGASKTAGDGAVLRETSSRESEDGTASASTATTAVSEDAALSA